MAEMTAADIRAHLAPMVHAFRALAELDTIVDAALALEGRTASLTKQRDDLTKDVEKLRGEVTAEKKKLDDLAASRTKDVEARKADDDAHRAKLRGYDREQRDAEKALAEAKAGLDAELVAAKAAHADALKSLTDERDRAQRELADVQKELARLHSGLAPLTGR